MFKSWFSKRSIASVIRIAPVLFVVMFLVNGCFYDKDIRKFHNDHEDFKREFTRINARMDTLQTRLDTLYVLLGGNVGDHFANQEEILRGMRADQRSVSREVENLIQTLSARVSDSDIHVRRLVQKLDEVNRLVTEIMSNQDSTIIDHTFDVNDPEKLYQQCFLDYSRGDNELARMGFNQYLELYPKTSLADNAIYWIAESYLTEGKQDSTLIYFTKLGDKYPKSNKIAPVLLKKALILAAKGDKPEAIKNLKTLIEKYPDAPEAKQAQIRLDELNEPEQSSDDTQH